VDPDSNHPRYPASAAALRSLREIEREALCPGVFGARLRWLLFAERNAQRIPRDDRGFPIDFHHLLVELRGRRGFTVTDLIDEVYRKRGTPRVAREKHSAETLRLIRRLREIEAGKCLPSRDDKGLFGEIGEILRAKRALLTALRAPA